MEDHLENKTEINLKKKRSIRWVLAIAIICLVAFTAGFGFNVLGLADLTSNTVRQWFGGENTVTPPDDTEEPDPGDIDDPDDPEPPPVDNPDDPDPPPDNNGTQPDPDTPVIYVGQILKISTPQGGGITKAQTVQSGTLSSTNKRIALTFDSGWLYEQTIPLLTVLDQYNITATFFPRAYWVQDHPDLAREIVRRGHTMGNHSLTHPHMTQMTVAQMRHEMRESTRIIQQVTGVRPFLFRPPYGEYDQRLLEVLAEEGYPYNVMWTIDTLDWAAGTTRNVGGRQTYIDVDFIVNRVLNNASNNGIVLMHIGGSDTVTALPRIIEGLRNMGYQFATVDEMLPPPGSGTITHTVKSGETLFSISQRYGVSVQQIISSNNLQ